MHEQIIAQKIIEEAKKHGNVKEITVEVGDLAHLPADDMKKTLDAMVPWKVIVVSKKAKVKCICGFEGEPKILEHSHDFTLFKCPECDEVPDEILEGDEIILKDVVVE